MELFILAIIFITGTVFGSFFTLAVYRIPLGKNITHERSFCPNCNHRLEPLDLIPVWSYIFLRGKCRYCKTKVRPRYLILEVLSGLVFVLVFASLKINIQNIFYLYIGINLELTAQKLIYFVFFVMFYSTCAIIIGIDNEYRKINNKVLFFGIICNTLYILYLYIFGEASVYKYGIYYLILFVLFLIYKIKNKENYLIQNLIFFIYILIFISNLKWGIVILFIATIIYEAYRLIFENKKTPIGFCLGISAILVVIVQNYLLYI